MRKQFLSLFLLSILFLTGFVVFSQADSVPVDVPLVTTEVTEVTSDTVVIDTLGIFGSNIVNVLSKIFDDKALTFWVAFLGFAGYLLRKFIRFLLEKVPVTWYFNENTKEIAVSYFFKFLSSLFGKSILYYGSNTDSETVRQELVRQELVYLRDKYLKKGNNILALELSKIIFGYAASANQSDLTKKVE